MLHTHSVTITELQVPTDVHKVVAALEKVGHAAYVVGGCVRDAIRGVDPQDWDVATDATPEQIQKLFAKSLYTNRFGTVVVRSGDLVHADRHGAVTIPEALAEKLPAACDLLARKEAVILEMARAPGFNVAKLREALQKQDEIH